MVRLGEDEVRFELLEGSKIKVGRRAEVGWTPGRVKIASASEQSRREQAPLQKNRPSLQGVTIVTTLVAEADRPAEFWTEKVKMNVVPISPLAVSTPHARGCLSTRR